MKINELIDKYITLRDAKAELEAAHKLKVGKYTKAMQKIENLLLTEFKETGQESAKTANGTAYVSTRTSAKVTDRDAFINFVRENEAWQFLENRVNKSAVEEHIQEFEELPAGVDISRSVTVNVRRS